MSLFNVCEYYLDRINWKMALPLIILIFFLLIGIGLIVCFVISLIEGDINWQSVAMIIAGAAVIVFAVLSIIWYLYFYKGMKGTNYMKEGE